jgi:hypothetical protein
MSDPRPLAMPTSKLLTQPAPELIGGDEKHDKFIAQVFNTSAAGGCGGGGGVVQCWSLQPSS